MSLLHRRGVKGYVTLNTLVFTDELAELERTVRLVAEAGVDAVLVQDFGAARLIRAITPDLPIHASTQMTLSSAESLRAAESLDIERVVLARELSIDEIGQIARQTAMPLEVFVHGALCVAYSGQCMTSESLGGRSANRGQCAQACRLPYELVCDGEDVDLGRQQYLLSPQDLAAFALVPELIAAGVSCFKIEGRLKTPEYVANITRHYRQAIDTAMAGRPVEFSPRAVEEMELSFSRGFSPGWLGGCDHKMLVPGVGSSKHGVLVGRVLKVKANASTWNCPARWLLATASSLRAYARSLKSRGAGFTKSFRGRVPQTERTRRGRCLAWLSVTDRSAATGWSVGQQLWKTDEPQLTKQLRASFAGTRPRGRSARAYRGRGGSRPAAEAGRAGGRDIDQRAKSNRPTCWPKRKNIHFQSRCYASNWPLGRNQLRIGRIDGRNRRPTDGAAQRIGHIAACLDLVG